jgi:hypothetical protein
MPDGHHWRSSYATAAANLAKRSPGS